MASRDVYHLNTVSACENKSQVTALTAYNVVGGEISTHSSAFITGLPVFILFEMFMHSGV